MFALQDPNFKSDLIYKLKSKCVNLGFRREVDENCALLSYYAASSGNFLPTFRDNLSATSSRVKNQVS
jgi:hypothetical protein